MLVAQPDHVRAGGVGRVDEPLDRLVQLPPAREHHQAAVFEEFVDHIDDDHRAAPRLKPRLDLLAVLGERALL